MGDMFKTVLAALDLGPASDTVAAAAEELAAAFGAKLALLHVEVGIMDVTELEFPYVPYDEDFEDANAKARASLERYAAKRLKKVKQVDVHVADGKVYAGILETAKRIGADLIVIGTHEAKGIERMLYGSPAQEVIRRTGVPVVVVPIKAG